MSKKPGRRILVAVDGSVYSTNAIRYLCTLFKGVTTIHFHLFAVVAAGSLPDAGREWLDETTLMNTLAPEARSRVARMKQVMADAQARMTRMGIGADQISDQVRVSRMGVAADILHEARHGLYDALVIGRRGLGKIEELFMGSVSAAILGRCHDVPVWIVDKTVESTSILVPVDGSLHSLLAVDHLAFIMGDNPNVEITLFHSSAMLADRQQPNPEEFYAHWEKSWCDRYLGGKDSLYEAPKQLLLQAGFPEEKIQWLHAFKGIEPARQIIRQALLDDFGTIVMGRRSDESARGLLHSISDRVVFMVENTALWIVG
ncbi:MAG: universal stress protein [Thermodesulfobacteriota bacterium]